MTRKVYCGNCGKIGHMYKTCTEPVISLGIILYRWKNNQPEYAMIRRKDSLGFVEFMRGNYNPTDHDYIVKLFEEMTDRERISVCEDTFDVLWSGLWLEKLYAINNKYKKEYNNSKNKFTKLKESGVLLSLKDRCKNHWEHPEWGFPKGRRNIKESDLRGATRECMEETGLREKDFFIHYQIDPFIENFVGSNKVRYRHIYYLARIYNNELELHIDTKKESQVTEIGKIGWYSYIDCITMIRQYNWEKKEVLSLVNSLISRLNIIDDNVNQLFGTDKV